MKCKECGAKIPENKKFCIDCGAWVNPPEERQCIHNNYYEPERYNYNSTVFKNKSIPTDTAYPKSENTQIKIPAVKKGMVFATCAIALVLIFAVLSTVAFNFVDKIFSDDSSWEDTMDMNSIITGDIESVDMNDGYADEQEQLALEYVENYVAGMEYGTFDKFTALDTEKLYRDITDSDISDAYNEPVSDIHGHISADIKSFANNKLEYFADKYDTDNISYDVTYSHEIDSDLLYEYYYINTDDILADADRKTADYLPDYKTMTDIYDICVDFIIDDGFTTYYESVWIVVADAGYGPEIVYDELLILEMFNTINY